MKYFFLVACAVILFSNCFDPPSKKPQKAKDSQIDFLAEGKKIASLTFLTLSSNLKKAMEEGGVSKAVQYCNLAATPLVDSLEQEYGVEIKRTSLKVRNPTNTPTKDEEKQLLTYQEEKDAGQELKPVLIEKENRRLFHAPIVLMDLCQKCHGTVGEDILSEDYATIQALYPSDQAIGYKSGELRGMWSIAFAKK